MRAIVEFCEAVGEEMTELIEEHERRLHRLPPRRTEPVTAVPYPDWVLTDEQTSRAIELEKEGATLEEISLALGVPDIVIERSMYDYRPPYREWLRRRGMG